MCFTSFLGGVLIVVTLRCFHSVSHFTAFYFRCRSCVAFYIYLFYFLLWRRSVRFSFCHLRFFLIISKAVLVYIQLPITCLSCSVFDLRVSPWRLFIIFLYFCYLSFFFFFLTLTIKRFLVQVQFSVICLS